MQNQCVFDLVVKDISLLHVVPNFVLRFNLTGISPLSLRITSDFFCSFFRSCWRLRRLHSATRLAQSLFGQSSSLLKPLCKKGCYTVLYNACTHVLCTRYTRVIRMCITLRMDTLYTVAYNNYSITLCITSV